MNWLKRNLYLVLGALAALVLLGLTGFYLYQQRQKEREVTSALDAQINEWKRLTSRNPSANEENIEAAKKEQERLSELLRTNREFYVPTATFTNMDSATFKTLLETTIYDLEQLASRSGVSLPRQYNFTAGRLRASVVFQEAELLPLAYQLVEIKALCEVLFDARIHSLVRIRRVPVSKQDTSSSEYLTGSKITTNAVTGAVVTPYEVTFQGFSSELAAVIAGLQRSRHAFIVKMMDVEHAADAGPAAMPDMPYAIPGGGTDADDADDASKRGATDASAVWAGAWRPAWRAGGWPRVGVFSTLRRGTRGASARHGARHGLRPGSADTART
jgi:type II secretory pathway pseudopilin PulG